jgi:signal transduction histidine kinase
MGMLDAIASDLNTPQSKSEQAEKSKGRRDADADSASTAAQAHGAGRAQLGFTVEQMVSEYRALRASVIRLWIQDRGELLAEDIADLMRFNEAIDQALAESTSRFAKEIEHSKDMFLAILGHDLRTPLGSIVASAQIMAQTKQLSEPNLQMARMISRSGMRMNSLIGDLIDFTRNRLGEGIPIMRAPMDISEVSRHTIDEIAAANPERTMNFQASGELHGDWDSSRISQALSNLVSNAVQYGSADTPINVTVSGNADKVIITVQNRGPVIPADQLQNIFDPFHRLAASAAVAPDKNLGIGLYIVEKIIVAHGGTIDVESTEDNGTTFTIHLPRDLAVSADGEAA